MSLASIMLRQTQRTWGGGVNSLERDAREARALYSDVWRGPSEGTLLVSAAEAHQARLALR